MSSATVPVEARGTYTLLARGGRPSKIVPDG